MELELSVGFLRSLYVGAGIIFTGELCYMDDRLCPASLLAGETGPLNFSYMNEGIFHPISHRDFPISKHCLPYLLQ